MVEYTFTFQIVNKTKNSGSERVAGLTLPLLRPGQEVSQGLAFALKQGCTHKNTLQHEQMRGKEIEN